MSYKTIAINAFARDIKKLTDNILDAIDVAILEIHSNPFIGESLKGNWKVFRSYHFGRKPEYRILYRFSGCKLENPLSCQLEIEHEEQELKECEGLLKFIRFGTREEFNKLYDLDKKIIENYKRTL